MGNNLIWNTRILARNGQNISDYCTSGTTVVRSTVQGTGICDRICSIVCDYDHLLPRVLKHVEAKAAVSCWYLISTVWLKNRYSLLFVKFVNIS